MDASRVLRLARRAAPMLADVLQTALPDPGIRAHMHRLGVGHKSSCKPGVRAISEFRVPGGILPALFGPRNRQRDTLNCHAVMPVRRFGTPL